MPNTNPARNIQRMGAHSPFISIGHFARKVVINLAERQHDLIRSDAKAYAIPRFLMEKLVPSATLERIPPEQLGRVFDRWKEMEGADEPPVKKAFVFSSYVDFLSRARKVFDLSTDSQPMQSMECIGLFRNERKEPYFLALNKSGLQRVVKPEALKDSRTSGIVLRANWNLPLPEKSGEELHRLFVLAIVREYVESPGNNSLYRRMRSYRIPELKAAPEKIEGVWLAFNQSYPREFYNFGRLVREIDLFNEIDRTHPKGLEKHIIRDGKYFRWVSTKTDLESWLATQNESTQARVLRLWDGDPVHSEIVRFMLTAGNLHGLLTQFSSAAGSRMLDGVSKLNIETDMISKIEQYSPNIWVKRLSQIGPFNTEILSSGYDEMPLYRIRNLK